MTIKLRAIESTQSLREKGKKAVRPLDAATVIIWRKQRQRTEILMGQRHHMHKFLPNLYVFPGGRVDGKDARVRSSDEMDPAVAVQLSRTSAKGRGRSIVVAAIRETFEETGLIIGKTDPLPHRPAPKGWERFFSAGYAPSLNCLEYIARAVTPVFRPIRFDTRFFMVQDKNLVGDIQGSGELEKLGWIPIDKTPEFELANVTRNVLAYAEKLIDYPLPQSNDRKIPNFKHLPGGKHVLIMQ